MSDVPLFVLSDQETAPASPLRRTAQILTEVLRGEGFAPLAAAKLAQVSADGLRDAGIITDTTGAEPHRPRQGPCGRCRSTVLWTVTAASGGTKSMPLDVDITADGNCYLVPDGRGGQWVRVIAPHTAVPPELEGEPRWTSHMWSCPGKIIR